MIPSINRFNKGESLARSKAEHGLHVGFPRLPSEGAGETKAAIRGVDRRFMAGSSLSMRFCVFFSLTGDLREV